MAKWKDCCNLEFEDENRAVNFNFFFVKEFRNKAGVSASQASLVSWALINSPLTISNIRGDNITQI